jgi:basic membrane protein A
MNEYLRKLTSFLLALLLLPALTACSDDDDSAEEAVKPQIIVMYSLGGLGDLGYNDEILRGVQAFRKDYPDAVDIYQYSPTSSENARRLLFDWLKRPESNIPALFVAAASDYEDLVVEALDSLQLTPNKRMLFFETTRRDLPITTFSISMYGAAFLAGVTAATCEGDSALVMLGTSLDSTIRNAADGFTDGYKYIAPSKVVDIAYLSDDWTGFSKATLAYENMFEWSKHYSFIMPVAGGSDNGVYRYTREFPNASPYVSGIDTDQSELSNLIVGSLQKFIKELTYEHLYEWLTTGELPESYTYDLRSGSVGWTVSPHYTDRFQQITDDNYQTATEKEEIYYGK